jgi:uncharacterized membrane protein YkvA (DUF1232 family)
MSKDRNLRKLKKNLNSTQSILGDLLHDVTDELETRLNKSKKVASKQLDKTSHQLDKTYRTTSKDLQKRYATTRKDVDKQWAKTRSQAENRYKDARAQASVAGEDLKGRAAKLLAAVAGGVLAARNKLTPDEQLRLSGDNDKRVSKTGYFLRFLTIATILVSKRKKLISLAQQLYAKVQDKGAREALTQEAKEQYDIMRRLIRAYANGQYREFPYKAILKVVAAVLYFVSVADLIPDFIPILGFTDDLAILAWVYASVKDDLQKFVDWEAAEEKRKARLAGLSSGTSTTTTASKTTSSAAKPATTSSNTTTSTESSKPMSSEDRNAKPNTASGGTSSATTKDKVDVNSSTTSKSSSSTPSGSSNSSTTGKQ